MSSWVCPGGSRVSTIFLVMPLATISSAIPNIALLVQSHHDDDDDDDDDDITFTVKKLRAARIDNKYTTYKARNIHYIIQCIRRKESSTVSPSVQDLPTPIDIHYS